MEGFQLWLIWFNLATKYKLRAPWYHDVQSAEISELVTTVGTTVRVSAGTSHGVAGAMQRQTTEPLYLNVHLPAGATFSQALPLHCNAFVFVNRGQVTIGEHAVAQQRMAILQNRAAADGVVLRADTASRLLLIAG